MALLKRLILVATTGYILCFFSELYFFNEGMAYTAAAAATDPAELCGFLLEMLLYYGSWAFVFLAAVTYFRVRSIGALFLAGALFGWLTEGTVVPVLYESIPGTIVWPSLGWHALVDVLLGWFGIRMLLRANRPWLTLAATIPLGLFWGIWSTWFWQTEFPDEPPPLGPGSFAAFSFSFGLLCVAAYALQQRMGGGSFRPTRWEVGVVSAWILFCFGVIAVPTYPFKAAVLPVLLGVVSFALSRNRRKEKRDDALALLKSDVHWINYAILCLMCPLASLSYAMMFHFEVRWPLAQIVGIPLIVVATVMLFVGFACVLKKDPPSSGCESLASAEASDEASTGHGAKGQSCE